MFPDPSQRSRAVGLWITAFSAGGAIGPVVGGFLLEHYWWGSVFLMALPVMALLLILGPRVLPEFKDPNAGRLDLLSAGLSLAAVLAVVLGPKELAIHGASPQSLLGLGVGVILGVVFWRRQKGLADPLIDVTVTSDEVKRGRPQPDMVFKAMQELGLKDAKRVAKVGDTPSDLEEGVNAGCGAVIGVTAGSLNAPSVTAAH